jgi:hypothetical protein
MKNILSILFIVCIVFVMVLGFYEKAYAELPDECKNVCFTISGICHGGITSCQIKGECDGASYDYTINCDQYVDYWCCRQECPC